MPSQRIITCCVVTVRAGGKNSATISFLNLVLNIRSVYDAGRRAFAHSSKLRDMNYIYGINAVAEALKARGRTFAWVGVAKERHDLRLKHVVDECRRQGVAVKFVPRDELDHMAGNNAHQGVVAVTSAKQYNDLEDIVAAKRGQYSLMVVLDGVEDPHNLGAILRTADAAGADGVVIPERRAAGVTAIVTKTSAGASE